MDKKTDGTQSKSRSPRRNKNNDGIQFDSNEYTGCKGGSEEGENQSVGGSGKTNKGKLDIEFLQQTFFEFTGKILGGLLVKSQNDKRVWEDRLQEAKDCIVWYENLLKRCEKEVSIAESQILEVEKMLSQLKSE